ncbi:SH3 domain-containing protein [Peptoclostridium litorale DSM 5388]|uniref:Uncharacterized protein n=1 Tax=Peptoclostridium litorale DSM 5388 TaxID=1121324 RepID=A0A069RIZ1_PEPLI|nr:glycosyl hydrolase family 18 protein [Peptoclostridium litorale]KDR96768.1 hypothetical protein CLIT_2c03740 [Peptoclostridium litorale DSM 5388]SIO34623.1 SH3 domain-containing protein [Peptoclostridium litorale DSM 5388]
MIKYYEIGKEREENDITGDKKKGILMGILIGCVVTAGLFGIWSKVKDFEFGKKETEYEHVIMGWDYLADKKFVSEKSAESGYNTVAPLWYKIEGSKSDIDGVRLKITSDSEYVNLAHKNGYKVWAMLSDGFSPTRSRLIFENEDKMNSIIDTIVEDVDAKGIDGVNVDFEGDGRKNREGFTRFVSILSQKLKESGKVISVDVTGYDSYSLSSYYDRAELSKMCDYIILMGYDEHWSGSKVAGSVSSIGWVKGNIESTLEEVPPEKLVLGIPFYTRTWRVVEGQGVEVTNAFVNVRKAPSTDGEKLASVKKGTFYKLLGSVDGEEIAGSSKWYSINYNGSEAYVHSKYVSALDYGNEGRASSKAHAIRIQNNMLKEKNMQVALDEASGQNIAVYENGDGSLTKIWLEDETAIKKRMEIVKELGLAGVSAWRLGYEDESTWKHVVEGLYGEK